jgi:hypothetical protein
LLDEVDEACPLLDHHKDDVVAPIDEAGQVGPQLVSIDVIHTVVIDRHTEMVVVAIGAVKLTTDMLPLPRQLGTVTKLAEVPTRTATSTFGGSGLAQLKVPDVVQVLFVGT